MIQRTLLRQSRALGSSIRAIPRSSLARPQFRPSTISQSAVSRPAATRWYSSEPEAKKSDEATPAESKDAKAAEDADPAKKELDAKNKEIIDLKVCHPTLFCISPIEEHELGIA